MSRTALETETQRTAQDPVCQMQVETRTAKHTSQYGERVFFFCSLLCRKAFEDEPQRYLRPRLRRRP